jgi:mannitol-specific phosphotransferase system IIBC component
VETPFRIAYTFFGAFINSYLAKGLPAGFHRVKAILPNETPEHRVQAIAFLMSVVIGSVGGYLLYDGNEVWAAVITGASAVAILKQQIGRPK